MKPLNPNPLFNFIKKFGILLFLGVLAGIPGGVLGSLFHHCIDLVTELRNSNSWLLYLLPAGGVLIALFYFLFRKCGTLDTDRVLGCAKGEKTLPIAIVPLIFISSAISHLLGASVGREGAALQLGGGLGYNLGKLLKLKKEHLSVIVMAGMCGVFAALFGTPVTAVFFAVEVTFMRVRQLSTLFSCLVSALCAMLISSFFGAQPIRFTVPLPEGLTLVTTAQVSVLAILCGLVSILFVFSIKKTEGLTKKLFPNSFIRAFAGGCVIILLTVLIGSRDYNGAGMDIIALAMEGTAKPEAFFLKIIFTAVSVASCFKGGEIVPAFFIGSTFGCFVGGLIGLDPAFGASIGFVSLFCGIVDCPVASLILAFEVFGGGSPFYFAVAVLLSYFFSGKFSVYKSHTA